MSSISTVLIDARKLAKPAVNIIVTHPEKKQKKAKVAQFSRGQTSASYDIVKGSSRHY